MIVKSWFNFSLWNSWYKPSVVKFYLDRESGLRNVLIPNFPPLSNNPCISLNILVFKSNLFISFSHAVRAISLGLVLINFHYLPRGHSSVRSYNFVSIIYSSKWRTLPNESSSFNKLSFSFISSQFWFNSSDFTQSGKRSLNLVLNSQQLHVSPNLKTFILMRSVFNPLIP